MKNRLAEIALIAIVLSFTIGITYARFQLTENITGSINVHSKNYCLENGITNLSDCMLAMENYSSSPAEAKAYITSKGDALVNYIAPTITYKEQKTEKTNTNGIVTTYAHFTLAKGYTFNSSTGMFTLTDYVNEELNDSHIGYYTCGGSTYSYTKCPTLYQILDYTTTMSDNGKRYIVTKAIIHSYSPIDSFDSQIGLYSTTDNDGTTYFYRGNVQNNYVSYAGYIWRIVRLNGDGSIRMIYSGTSTSDTGSKTSISTEKYNEKDHDLTYAGYKYSEDFQLTISDVDTEYRNVSDNVIYYYGTNYEFDEETKKFVLSGEIISGKWQDNYENIISNYPYTCFKTTADYTCNIVMNLKGYVSKNVAIVNYISYSSKSYESTLNNTTDSNIKKVVDTWYESNILNKKDSSGKQYSSYLADSTFCNDRSVKSGSGYLLSPTTLWGGYIRIERSNKTPTLICEQSSDRFSVSNGNLKYPIALLTVDEASFAGGLYTAANTNYYLYTGQTYWTMTPEYYTASYVTSRVFYVDTTGGLDGRYVGGSRGVRPVINLKSDIKISRGTGTADDPYMVSLD